MKRTAAWLASRNPRYVRQLVDRLAAPVPALPLDLFRIAVGLLALGYLARSFYDAPAFFAAGGLIDHALSTATFPFSAQPIFHPDMSAGTVRAILAAGGLPALALVLGVLPRLCALLLYVLVVCLIRYGYLLLGVDEMLVQLLLFWVMLLPVGYTLTVPHWLRSRSLVDAESLATTVPGTTTRLFLGNIALLYLVAGAAKWASPMWREGHALYAVLKIPAAWWPDLWNSTYLPGLVIQSYVALVLEPLFALLVFLPAFTRAKLALAFVFALFHLGIIAVLDVPFANLGCLAAGLIIFRDEITAALRRRCSRQERGRLMKPALWRASVALGTLVLGLLTGAMATVVNESPWRAPARASSIGGDESAYAELGGTVQRAFFSALWALGLAQRYRLLDWIDERNFHLRLDVVERRHGQPDRRVPARRLVPRGMRGSLALTYVLGVTWKAMPAQARDALARSQHRRMAMRYCAQADGESSVAVDAYITRIRGALPAAPVVEPLLRFQCARGHVAALEPYAVPWLRTR